MPVEGDDDETNGFSPRMRGLDLWWRIPPTFATCVENTSNRMSVMGRLQEDFSSLSLLILFITWSVSVLLFVSR